MDNEISHNVDVEVLPVDGGELIHVQPSLNSEDEQLIELWLNSLSKKTQEAYRNDIEQFNKFMGFVPMRTITLMDLQKYLQHLESTQVIKKGKPEPLAASTIRRKINAMKSLFGYATRLGFIPFNVAAAVKVKGGYKLTQRILTPVEVMRLIDGEPDNRNKAFLRLLYAVGARVSEAIALTWENFDVLDNGQVQVRILGKGNKWRTVLLPMSVWMELDVLRGDAPIDASVFGIKRTRAHEIIKGAAARAKIRGDVSCHWLRHAHAQHALKGNAPLHLVRDTLGHSSIAITNMYLGHSPDDSSSNYLGL